MERKPCAKGPRLPVEPERLEAEQGRRARQGPLGAEHLVKEDQERLEAEQARGVLERATKERPWQNSLGMKFVPVPGTQVLFSIWDTRVADFGAFVESTGYDATRGMWSLDKDGWKTRGKTWNDPGFTQVATRPVVGISWEDAKAFCEWLARREHRFGSLPKGMFYRLPTDEEWSLSAGLGPEAGNTPQEKDSVIRIYPWGKDWPPPPGAGNYCGIESTIGKEPMAWPVIEGYNDGHSRTSPVGSFAPKKNGLYDIGGNVWQYCEDWYNSERKCRVVRGGSWNNNDPENLLASFRGCCVPDDRSSSVGMRCVVAWEA